MVWKLFFKSIIVRACFLLIIPGCTGGGVGNDADDPSQNKAPYKAGASVAAVPYKLSQSILLFIKDRDGFKPLSNGDYVPLGMATLGIKVAHRLIDDAPIDQRVFISDGGYETHAEAFWGEENELYIAEFEVTDIYLTHPILVQVIYPDGTASKEKFVCHTNRSLKPASGILVRNGLGITMGKDLLSGFTPLLEGMLAGMLGMRVQVEDFSPANNAKASEQGVFHLTLKNLLDGDMVLSDIKKDTRGLNIEFEDLSLLRKNGFGQFMGNLLDPFLQFSLGSVGFDLADMLGGLGGDERSEDDMMATLLGNLDIQQMLFVNVFGAPLYTTPEFAALGGGLFAYDKLAVERDEEGDYLWPDVSIDETTDPIDLTRMTDNPDVNLGIALSQYNLNQVLSDMMTGFVAVLDAKALDLPFITPENPGDPMEIHITVNPAGIAIDFSDA